MILENKHIIPVEKRKEANKQPHGSNFHMMKSEVPDGSEAELQFLMGVRHMQRVQGGMRVSKRSRKIAAARNGNRSEVVPLFPTAQI